MLSGDQDNQDDLAQSFEDAYMGRGNDGEDDASDDDAMELAPDGGASVSVILFS
jgi:hypothetical protein